MVKTSQEMFARQPVSEPTVAYHGTPNIGEVLAEGLHADSWMALDPTEAARYGDVVAVDLTQLDGEWPRSENECDGPIGSLIWQAHTNELAIPASALSPYITSITGDADA